MMASRSLTSGVILASVLPRLQPDARVEEHHVRTCRSDRRLLADVLEADPRLAARGRRLQLAGRPVEVEAPDPVRVVASGAEARVVVPRRQERVRDVEALVVSAQ